MGFMETAAADSKTASGPNPLNCRSFFTLCKLFHKSIESWTSGSVWVQVFVSLVPSYVRWTNGQMETNFKTNLMQMCGTKNLPCLFRGNNP